MTDDARFESLRLADSSLSVGAYTVSYSLEQLVQEELISDADDFRVLLLTYLKQQVGPCEPVALRTVHTAVRDGDFDAVCRANYCLTAATLSKEFRRGARQSGNRLPSFQRKLRESPLLDEYAGAVDAGDATGNYAVVLDAAAANTDIDTSKACLFCYHGFTTGPVEAAQRVLSFGHTDAQRILRSPQPVMTETAADNAGRGIGEVSPFTPLIGIPPANHECVDRWLSMS